MANTYTLDLSAPRVLTTSVMRSVEDKINYEILRMKLKNKKSVSKVIKEMDVVLEDDIFSRVSIKVLSAGMFISLIFKDNIKVMAYDAGAMTRALDPLINLLQELGYPVAFLAITGGALVMTFNRRQGVKIIKEAITAFLALQLIPGLMKALVAVGKAMRAGL